MKRRPDSAAGPFHDGICLSLRGDAGAIDQRVRHGAGARSRQLYFPFLRMGVHGIWQDRACGGFCPPGCGFGMGRVCDAIHSFARRQGCRRRARPSSTCRPRRAIIAICWRLAWELRPESDLDRIAHEERKPACRPILIRRRGITRERFWRTAARKQAALHLLQSAVEQNYCAYSNLLSDPLLAKLRTDTEFDKVLTQAGPCQEAVRAAASSRRSKIHAGNLDYYSRFATSKLLQSRVVELRPWNVTHNYILQKSSPIIFQQEPS